MQAANLIHAAGESSPGDLRPGTYAVALAVPDEVTLWRIAERLRRAHVAHVPVIEADGPFAGQLLALGVAPRRKEELRRHLSDLALVR